MICDVSFLYTSIIYMKNGLKMKGEDGGGGGEQKDAEENGMQGREERDRWQIEGPKTSKDEDEENGKQH